TFRIRAAVERRLSFAPRAARGKTRQRRARPFREYGGRGAECAAWVPAERRLFLSDRLARTGRGNPHRREPISRESLSAGAQRVAGEVDRTQARRRKQR